MVWGPAARTGTAIIEQLAKPLTEEAFSEDTAVIFGTQFFDEKGIRFVMATAEGKHGSKPFCMDYSLETPALDKLENSDNNYHSEYV